MTKRTRRTHSAAVKAKVALAVVEGERIHIELAQQFDVHPNPDHGMEAAVAGTRSRRVGHGGCAIERAGGGCENAAREDRSVGTRE